MKKKRKTPSEIKALSNEWKQRSPSEAREYWNNKSFQEQKDEWENTHQEWELLYHKQGNYRLKEELWNQVWDNVFSGFMEFAPDKFKGNDVLFDLGCGSRPALSWFTKGTKHHLDPLLSDFKEIPAMKNFWENEQHFHSQPAEVLVEELVGKCDYVHCWNVLDHTYDWRKIIENFCLYSKSGGIALLGTDMGPTPSIGHTGINAPDELLSSIKKEFDVLKILDKNEGVRFKYCRDLCLKLRKK